MKYKVAISITTIILNCTNAAAGTRGSFYILTYPLDKNSETALEKPFDNFFNSRLSENFYNCASINDFPEELSFERVFTKRRPASIKIEDIAKALQGDSISTKKIQSVLKKYHDEKIPHGFDIFIAYTAKNNKATFYITAPEKKGFSTFISNKINDKEVAKILCPAIKDIGFSPYIEP